MTDEKRDDWLTIRMAVHGTLYLLGCFIAGLFFSGWAWKLALASAAASYLGCLAQMSIAHVSKNRGAVVLLAVVLFFLSIAFGAFAGILLLMVKP